MWFLNGLNAVRIGRESAKSNLEPNCPFVTGVVRGAGGVPCTAGDLSNHTLVYEIVEGCFDVWDMA